MKLLAKHGKSWLEPEDLVPLIQVVSHSIYFYVFDVYEGSEALRAEVSVLDYSFFRTS